MKPADYHANSRHSGDDGEPSSRFFLDEEPDSFSNGHHFHKGWFEDHGRHNGDGGGHGHHDGHGFHIAVQGGQWVITNGHASYAIAGNTVVFHGETYLLVDHFGAGYQSIQAAVDAAAGGETVLVAGGTYLEQVTVAGAGKDGLTIEAAVGEDVVVGPPAALVKTADDPNTGRAIFGLVTVDDADGVTVRGLTVDGAHRGGDVGGPGNPTLAGVVYVNGDDGLIDGVVVTGVREPDAQFGNQRGVGIYVTNDDPSPGVPHTPSAAEADALNSIEIRNSTVEDFQKVGIRVSFADAEIEDNTITGYGATGSQAQNGIQIFDSTGSIEDNAVSAIGYTGFSWAASGILAFENRDLAIDGNTVTGTGSTHSILGITQLDSVGGRITHNTISSVGWAIDAEDYPTGWGYPDPMEPGDHPGYRFDYSSNTLSDIGYNGVWFQPDAASTDVFNATGTAVDDVMFGAAGNDRLSGGNGVDYLSGEAGADRLTGGGGADELVGGLGADLFKYGSVGESAPGAGNFDTIDDFTPGADKIDLSAIDAKTSQGGDQAFGFVAAQTAVVQANKVTWYQDVLNNETVVQADNNGNAVADLQIHLAGILTLTAGDFVL
jgi:Ca2+-binding RTX toxin-like protein